MIFLCSLILQISGSGGTIIAVVTRSRVCINCSLAKGLIVLQLPQISFGTNSSPEGFYFDLETSSE